MRQLSFWLLAHCRPTTVTIATICCSTATINTAVLLLLLALKQFCKVLFAVRFEYVWFSQESCCVLTTACLITEPSTASRSYSFLCTYEKNFYKKKNLKKIFFFKKVYMTPTVPPTSFWSTYRSSMHIWYYWLLFLCLKKKSWKKTNCCLFFGVFRFWIEYFKFDVTAETSPSPVCVCNTEKEISKVF